MPIGNDFPTYWSNLVAGVTGTRLIQSFDASAHEWRDHSWTGRQLAGSVIYELQATTGTARSASTSAQLGVLRNVSSTLE